MSNRISLCLIPLCRILFRRISLCLIRPCRIPLYLVLGLLTLGGSVGLSQAQLGGAMKVVGAKKKVLKLKHIEPKLAALPLGELKFKGIKYSKIGEGRYDNFFRSTAALHGLVEFNKELTTSAIQSLKKFAMSKAADAALKDNIHELVGDVPPKDWTTEQDIAVMRMAKQQDKVSADENRYFVKTAAAMALGGAVLTKSLKTTKALAEEGVYLQKSAGDLPKLKVVPATDATKHSIDHIKAAAADGPRLAEEIKVLVLGFQALAADEEEEEEEEEQ
jgi:hypothetical protein